MMDGGFSKAMAVSVEILVMQDQNKFQCDTALSAWKRRWAVLRKRGARIMIDARFADILLI